MFGQLSQDKSEDTIGALPADVVRAISKVLNHGPCPRCFCSLRRSFGIRYFPKRTSSGVGGCTRKSRCSFWWWPFRDDVPYVLPMWNHPFGLVWGFLVVRVVLCSLLRCNLFFSYILRLGVVRGVRLGLTFVWNSFSWAIWSFQNDYICVGGSVSVEALVDRAKILFVEVVYG